MAESSGRANGWLAKMDSSESRWVSQGEEYSSEEEEEEEELVRRAVFESEEEDSGTRRLIRTAPRLDSFDVEALDVPGVQRNEVEELDLRKNFILALQTLGIVFGDVGTSPLYTFDVMLHQSPVRVKEDVIGALSLVLYTLILIPLVKYVLVVIWGNDDGEGGTFALYSLICRHAKVSLLPNQLRSDTHISSFRLKVPSPELERSLKVKEHLESSLMLKKLLLILVLFGTSMVIADGVVTPAMSVLSAVGGLKVGIASFEKDEAVMISVAFLVILFSVQKYGTSKVGLAVGPALLVWLCSLGGIGVYNLIKYGVTVLRAFNPVHIYYYFERNLTQAWLSLGGCLLCATGSEAMFADLCYFSVRSVQLTFVFLVLPCLLLGYLGQAAFLMENVTTSEQVFFSSIPSGAFWPVLLIANIAALIASRTMTTATFSCIKQSTALGCFPRLKIIHTSRKFMGQIYIPVINWFLLVFCLAFVATFGSITDIGNAYGTAELGIMMMTTILVTIIMLLIWQINIFIVLFFVIFFLGVELVFFTSVLGSVEAGSWVLLIFAAILFMIMYIWNYGSKLKYESEVKQKLSMNLMMELGCNLGTIRAPGVGLVYNELVKGIPAIFGHFLTTLPAIHSMIILVCIKYVPVPVVPQSERFLFRRVCPKSYHMFRCIARYGYKDVRKEQHQIFEQLLLESLEKFIHREAQERLLESDGDSDSDAEEAASRSRILIAPNGSMYSFDVPLLAAYNSTEKPSPEASTSSHEARDEAMPDARQSLEQELSFINKAKESGVVYLLGHGDIRARKDSWFFKKLVINYFYAFLKKNCRRAITTLTVPHTNLMQVGMTYMV
ncbi:potassium transporter 7 isoform X1 [Elaeis guineensis]|uniref:Potassium transporter n=1 Tax=Elaeis guineensis var. tenera TaxID=51953 RepID=A0A6I9QRX6_ELAGV|nr:potassium transporter 7 isoform X1 [Elaeis guineensis]